MGRCGNVAVWDMGFLAFLLTILYVVIAALSVVVLVLGAYALLAYVRSMRPIVMASLAGDTLRVTNAGKSGIYGLVIETMLPQADASSQSAATIGPRLSMAVGNVGAGREVEVLVTSAFREKIEAAGGRVQAKGLRTHQGTPFRQTLMVFTDASGRKLREES